MPVSAYGFFDSIPAGSSEAEDPGYKFDPAEIVDLLPRLPPAEQQLVDMILFQGLSQVAAGERVGVNQPSVSHRLQHAYALLRHWAQLPPLDLALVEQRIRTRYSGRRGPEPDVKRWTAILEMISEGHTQTTVANRLGMSNKDVFRIVERLRAFPELRPYLWRPPWPKRKHTKKPRP